MSFFKKLLGTQNKTPDELEADRIRKMEKQAEMKRQEEIRKREYEDKKRERDAKNAQDKALQEKYIGLGFGTGFDFAMYKGTIQYFESVVLQVNEQVLHSIKAEYDKTKKREIKGLLIATNQRLVFVSSGAGYGQFFEEFDYRKMNGIAQANDGFLKKKCTSIWVEVARNLMILSEMNALINLLVLSQNKLTYQEIQLLKGVLQNPLQLEIQLINIVHLKK